MKTRAVKHVSVSQPTSEGAGVRLRRAFGFGNTADHDPFLLLDDFRNDDPHTYKAGFPWHPHRGMETITYVLAGTIAHRDSLGNEGVLGPGDVQWMTAGSGILHQEMPAGDDLGRMYGFQLWANLPAALKMTPPRYQDIKSRDIPEVTDHDGTRARVICGEFQGESGPVRGVATDPRYLDILVPPGRTIHLPVDSDHQAFAYVFQGSGSFADAAHAVEDRCLVVFDEGDEVVVHAGNDGLRFLLVSGKPIREPVAWRGPIVMNTREELLQAFDELQRGTFIKGSAGQ